MSTFSASKAVPGCLSSSSVLHITQISKKSMDPPCNPDLHHPQNFIPDDKIKPLIVIFDEKIKVNHSVISNNTAADADTPRSINTPDEKIKLDHAVISSCNVGNGYVAADNDPTGVIRSSAYQSAGSAAEVEVWPKVAELDDRPSSPEYHREANEQVISEPTYQADLNDRLQGPDSDAASSERRILQQEVISEAAYQPAKQDDGALSCNNQSASEQQGQEKLQEVIRESADQSRSTCEGARRDEYHTAVASSGDELQQVEKPEELLQAVIREGAYQSPPHDTLSGMKESYRASAARGRLSRVVEESESFSRREFGATVLNYMSTHNSANHLANLSYLTPNSSDFTTSKSAPAGTATRTGSTFAFFRRGASEGGGGGHLAGRPVFRRRRSRKPRSLGSRLLWPLLKIRNGYVGCMMGLEGNGDLSGMAQGGTYATTSRYFADAPLSKTDSRNHG